MTAASFVRALRLATTHVTKLEQGTTVGLEPDDMASAIAVVQDLRARLATIEADMARDLGKRVGKTKGYLPDGRQYEVTRGGDRTAWDHDDWKRDVRREVTEQTLREYLVPEDQPGCLVSPDGEVIPFVSVVQQALARAQEVHGATAPKSTALKALGLYAGDYSTTTPGPWRFSAVKPTTTTSSPEQKATT